MGDSQKCLIIGAAGGIGRALAAQLHQRGWELVLAGRRQEPLDDLATSLKASCASLDARDFDAVDQLFGSQAGSLTAVVNLAGSILLKPAHSTSAREFEETMDVNLRTAFAVVRAAGKHFKPAGGSVVLMSSCAAAIGLPNHEAISAAKAAVEGLVRSAAATYAGSGIRFNAVAPGLVDTPLASRITGNESALKASIAMHAMGRIGKPEEVARLIAFVLDGANSFITGQVFGIDGGLSRVKGRG
jgi:NAD(P)-dependent dehydrogenase (short-subunit alcohol dehydrogenase family)